MALYSQLLSRAQNIKIRSYPIARPEATPVFFTLARLLQQSILVDRTRLLPNFLK